MSGYTKNIAVIRGLKDGFSADGGSLSGLVRAEKYGASLKIEITLINFAPLSEGRYVAAVGDGNAAVLVEDCLFEGVSEVDTSRGFAAEIFYVHGGVYPVATAICGGFQSAAIGLKAFVESTETVTDQKKTAEAERGYQDEAIAEVNYYEYAKTDKDGEPVFENKTQEAAGPKLLQNEANTCAVEERQDGADVAFATADPTEDTVSTADISGAIKPEALARGRFYEKMRAEIEGILSAYPAEEALCRIIENSKWVRINYGDDKYYVFGVIFLGETPKYICYGVPSDGGTEPPESMAGLAGFIPVSPDGGTEGYWVMYQDADTGASLHINFE